MLHYLASGLVSQLRCRAVHIRDVAAAARLPSVARELAELAQLYDDVATNAAAQAETVLLTMADIPVHELVDHLQESAQRLRRQAWTASDRSLADQLRSLSANFDAEAIRLVSEPII